MNIPDFAGYFPPAISGGAEEGERVDPYAFSEGERVLWKALDFSRIPSGVYRKACLTGSRG